MKTITKEIKLYRYNELSEEAREKANEEYLEINRYGDYFEELVKYDLKYAKDCGWIENIKVVYDLGYRQGDYVDIIGSIYFEDLNNELKKRFCKGLSNEELNFFKQFEKYSEICFRELYVGSNCVEINIQLSATPEEMYDLGLDNDFKFEDQEKYYKISPKIEKNIEEWHDEICEEYQELGYIYFYEADEDEIKEYYEDTEQLFLENGEMYEEE
ncbi:MAG: hypothetical protein IJP99_05980 [Methanobrevibacter sp.]|nr:hypothetical protein [Methanobrevibacter sp.]